MFKFSSKSTPKVEERSITSQIAREASVQLGTMVVVWSVMAVAFAIPSAVSAVRTTYKNTRDRIAKQTEEATQAASE